MLKRGLAFVGVLHGVSDLVFARASSSGRGVSFSLFMPASKVAIACRAILRLFLAIRNPPCLSYFRYYSFIIIQLHNKQRNKFNFIFFFCIFASYTSYKIKS